MKQDSRLPFHTNEIETRAANRKCAQSGADFGWGGTRALLGPTVVDENGLRISALKLRAWPIGIPSDATGYILPEAWGGSILGFYYFDLLNARVAGQ